MRKLDSGKDDRRQATRGRALGDRSRTSPLLVILACIALILLAAVIFLLLRDKVLLPDKEQGLAREGESAFHFAPPSEEEILTEASTSVLPSGESENTATSNTNVATSASSARSSTEGLSTQEKQAQADLIQAHIQQNFDPSQLVSQTYCLMDFETGLVLAEENADQAFPPASLTKVLTALLALDHYSDLNQEVIIQEQDIAGLAEADASTAGFQAGQSVTIEDLLNGLLLPSGADAAHALAREISGSQEAFVQAMNAKAQDLGLKHSHFTNPTGLPEEGLYSTAHDMAKLFWSASQDERFVKIAGSNSYGMAPDDFYPEGLGMLSTFIWKFNSDPDFATRILAGKSGYTGKEQCQASLFEKNGRRYVLITLGALTDDPNSATAVHDQVVVMNDLVK